ncbi:MAG: YbaB/EbfC family nucleoid-associated protein [Methylophilaceae bacterium]
MLKGGMGNLMKQAQQMQENMKRAQAELANVEVEGQAGSGMVKVVMTCRNEVKRVSIDDSLMGDDKEMLEDLIVTALNDAARKAEATSQERMGGLMAGLPIPPGMKLPF